MVAVTSSSFETFQHQRFHSTSSYCLVLLPSTSRTSPSSDEKAALTDLTVAVLAELDIALLFSAEPDIDWPHSSFSQVPAVPLDLTLCIVLCNL